MNKTIYRIVFHTKEEKEIFEEVKKLLSTIIPSENIRTFEPHDGGKKVISFAAGSTQKKKLEKLLKDAGFPVSISSPLVQC